MKNFKSNRKPGGFGGGSKFKSRDDGRRGDFSRSSDRGGRDRGGRSFDSRGDRPEMFETVCSECGDDCEVPFRPSGSKPVYCSTCFGNQGGSSRDFTPREFSREKSFEKKMFKAVCETCGNDCEVPFRPTEGKSVFCDICFRGSDVKVKSKETKSGGDNYTAQFAALNTKLDEILRALKGELKPEKTKEIKEVKEIKKIEEVVVKENAKVKKPSKAKVAKKAAEKKIIKKKSK